MEPSLAERSIDFRNAGAAGRGDLKGPPQRDYAVEGLRGFAALTVFYHHLMLEPVGGWAPSRVWTWFVSGPAAVLVFFVLSGYVIGLSYRGPASVDRVKGYFFRRAVRLVPINCFGVLLACVAADAVDLPTVIGNLLFLQNFADYSGHWLLVLRENFNLWSLNYEVLFYGFFVLVWWPRIPLRVVVTASFAIGVLGWFGLELPVFMACYAFGFLFWLAGLGLAWRSHEAPTGRSNWPTALLLALVTWKLQPFANLMLAFDPFPPRFAGPVVKLYHLDFLPVCVWLVAAVARRLFHGFMWIRAVAAIIPLMGLVWTVRHPSPLTTTEVAMVAGIYGVALLLWRWEVPVRWWARLAPVGAISYALYATARPIQIAIFNLGQNLPANSAGFAVCAAATTTVAMAVAWYLERRLQPAISAAFTRRLLDRTKIPSAAGPASAARSTSGRQL
jgi:peptidoglycan/LPS O-acetylase OafA/YrhL